MIENDTEALAALAAAVGVSPSYTDLLGVDHPVGRETLVALLSLMGFAVDTAEDIAASQDRLVAEAWDSLLPPVVIFREGQEYGLPVSVLAGQGGFLNWRIDLENGKTLSSKIPVKGMPLAATMPRPQGVIERRRLMLPDGLPLGYQQVSVTVNGETATTTLIIAPSASWLPDTLAAGERIWGIAAQLYSVRSETEWGMGDLGDLAVIAHEAGVRGADAVGINPLHALFPGSPEGASPYSPSSRLFLNPLYISIEVVPEYAAGRVKIDDLATRLKAARAVEYVDYTAVAALKWVALESLYTTFRAVADPNRRRALEAFVTEGGGRLKLFAVHQALEEHFKGEPWHRWPLDYQDPAGAAVAAFAAEQADRVGYFLWLQFEVDRQLAAAAAALKAAGGRVGLYLDLAVGTNSDGADLWIDRAAYAVGARFGAPPDPLGPLGQDWGLPPLDPRLLRKLAYAPFIALLRSNMRHAGALRLDHAMGLTRLFWIMPGMTAKDGVYVRYPVDDLLAIVALESHRNQCVVIGEDLGTVPDGFREKMAAEKLLAYRLFYFERWPTGLFKRPDAYPALALATATSHDVFTIVGHWEGWDIALRHRLGLAGDNKLEDDLACRAEDRRKLLAALQDQAVIAADFPSEPGLSPADHVRLIEAVQRYLARSPALLHIATLDDLAAEASQVNVPGTVDEYPNWRRRLATPLKELFASETMAALVQAMVEERPRRG